MIDNNTLGITTSLAIGSAFLLFVVILYDIIRNLFPSLAYHREDAVLDSRTLGYDQSPISVLPRPPPWPLGWIQTTLLYPEQRLIRTHGLDVAMYLRFLATQAKVFAILTIFTIIVLYPTYVTGPNRHRPDDDPLRAVGIEILSLSNIDDKSSRLWVTLVSEIFVVAIFCFFLYHDIRAFTEYRRLYRKENHNPSNYTIIIQDIPVSRRTKEQIYSILHKIFPDQVVQVNLVRDARYLQHLKQKYIRALKKGERAELEFREKVAKKDYPLENSDIISQSTDMEDRNVSKWREEQARMRLQIENAESNLDITAPLTHAAFVTFRTKKAATLAATAPVWVSGNRWEISRAAEPRGILWHRLPISRYTEKVRGYVSFTVLTAMTVLWAVPASLIQAVGSFQEIADKFPDSFISDVLEQSPDVARFLEGFLPPFLLYLALWVVPFIVRFVVRFERIHSRVVYESKIRNFVLFFYIMSNFTYVVTIGSALAKFKELWENPKRIVSLLSTSVPAQSTFLMNYVLISSFIGSTIGMLNHGRLLVRPFAMLRAKTEREKKNANMILTQFPFAKMYAVCTMIAFISFVYCTIAPLICAVALLYFCLAYIFTKQLLLYSHRPRWEGGGYMFRDAWTGLLAGLYVHQISMIAIFSLKRATAQAILAGLSFAASLLFTRYCRNNFLLRAKHGTLMDQVDEAGEDEMEEGEMAERFESLYVHPGLMSIEEIEKIGESVGDSRVEERRKGRKKLTGVSVDEEIVL